MAQNNKTKHLILGMLAHRSMTGYDIKKKMNEYIRYFWKTGYGQLYPTLAGLKSSGLIKEESDVKENNRNSKTYSITPKGMDALEAWLKKPMKYESVKYEHLLQLFFSANVPIQYAIKNVERYVEENRKLIETVTNFREKLLPQLDVKDHMYYLLTSNFGIHIFTAQYEWGLETIKELKKMQKSRNTGKPLRKERIKTS
jgi:PadR family transcriptional regulator, regulatory protein AphA